MKARGLYRITSTIPAIHLSGRKRGIARIPPGSVIQLPVDLRSDSSMVEVAWKGRKLAVFAKDFDERSKLIETRSVAGEVSS
jgi:hypothetical protein